MSILLSKRSFLPGGLGVPRSRKPWKSGNSFDFQRLAIDRDNWTANPGPSSWGKTWGWRSRRHVEGLARDQVHARLLIRTRLRLGESVEVDRADPELVRSGREALQPGGPRDSAEWQRPDLGLAGLRVESPDLFRGRTHREDGIPIIWRRHQFA